MSSPASLDDALLDAAAAGAAFGTVSAVLAAEMTDGSRAYLVALGDGEDRCWVALDGVMNVADERERVREVASIIVLCELAADLAGGGQLEELRNHLATVRMTEQPPGIEVAEEAALALEQVVGSPPYLASPRFLDEIGAASRRLEEALGDRESPFAAALATSSGAVEAFVAEVIGRHAVALR